MSGQIRRPVVLQEGAMGDHRRQLEAWLDAYGNHDRQTMLDSLTEDAVWHVGGTHRHSGEYRGREAILGYFDAIREATADTMRLEPLEILADDRYGAAFLRVSADRDGRRLETVAADAFRFDDNGRIAEFWASNSNQAAIDEFWA
jgi:ketosteroid isomerase-like protein